MIDWRRNLVIMAGVSAISTAAWTQVNPFYAIFLERDLGLEGPDAVAFWAGLLAGLAPLGAALSSPFWGWLADRGGKKLAVLRSIVGTAVFAAIMAFVRTPPEAAAVALVLGAFGGIQLTALALVATETPRPNTGRALGIMAAARSAGQAIGPLVGGLLTAAISFRAVILEATGCFVLLILPVALGVQEGAIARDVRRPGLRAALTAGGRWLRRTLLVLGFLQLTVQFALTGSQQLLVLRMIELAGHRGSIFAGLAFTLMSMTAIFAATTYTRLAERTTLGATAAAAFGLLAVALVGLAVAGAPAVLVLAAGAVGLAFGVISPAINTLIGLHSPESVRATVFGLTSAAFAAGTALGPVACGALAALTNLGAGFLLAAALALAGALVAGALVRDSEPGPDS